MSEIGEPEPLPFEQHRPTGARRPTRVTKWSTAPSEDPDLELNLVRFGRSIGRHRVLFAVVAGTIIALGVLRILVLTPQYDASAQVLLDASEDLSTATELQVASSSPIEDAALAALGEDAAGVTSLRASALGTTTVLEFTARSAEPDLARRAADAYADAYSDRRITEEQTDLQQQADIVAASIAELTQELATIDAQLAAIEPSEDPLRPSVQFIALQAQRDSAATRLVGQQAQADDLSRQAQLADGDLERLEPASEPGSPASPLVARDLMLATILGVVVAAVVCNVRDITDDRLREGADAGAIVGVPVLGTIPRNPNPSDGMVLLADPDSPNAEAFRAIRTAIVTASHHEAIRSVLVTSATQGDGKTTVAANLAAAFALDGRRVTVVDADMRRPALHRVLGTPDRPGLSDVLANRVEMSSAWVAVNGLPRNTGFLRNIPAGPVPPNPAELLGSVDFTVLSDALVRTNHLVIYDAPPLLPVTDSVLVAQRVDAVILVASATHSRRRNLRAVAELAQRTNLSVLGVVVNGVDSTDSGYLLPHTPERPSPIKRAKHLLRVARERAGDRIQRHRPNPES